MNRREALQAGLGIISAVGIEGEVATISTRKPQAFVITTPKRVSASQIAAIRDEWKAAFRLTDLADVPVLLMQDGMQLSVIDECDQARCLDCGGTEYFSSTKMDDDPALVCANCRGTRWA